MKTWTVVIEVKDFGQVVDGKVTDNYLSTYGIKDLIKISLTDQHIQYSIYECTEAPYGPQGVVLKESNSGIFRSNTSKVKP